MSLQNLEVCVKVEPGSEGDTDVSEALVALYAGHVVKEELVLGPELLQSAAVFELRDPVNKNVETNTQASLDRTCSVRLERMLVDMEHHTCQIGGKTYRSGWCLQNQETRSEDNSRQTFNNPGQAKIKNEPSDTSNNENTLLANYEGLHGAKYFCNECQYSTNQAESLLTHFGTHAEEKPFKCSECSSAFVRKSDLKTHIVRKHDRQKPIKCSQCSLAFANKGVLNNHMLRVHNSKKPIQCNQCNSVFACIAYLKVHLRTHSGEKPYKCNQCSAAFTQSCHVTRHLKTHTDVKSYECSMCNSKFRDRWSLARHVKTHTGKKGYKCSECGAAFNQSCNLLRHQRIHTGEKRYKCSYCDAAFVQSCDLGKHLKIHSGKGCFECNFCAYRTAKLNILKVHINKWHSDQKSNVKMEV